MLIKKYDFFSDISPEEEERIEKLADLSLLVGMVRLEIEAEGKHPEWAERLEDAQQKIDDLM